MLHTLLAAAVLGFALAMLSMHRRTWQQVKTRPLRGEDRLFLRHRYHRRVQASALLTVIAVAIFLAQWVSPQREPVLYASLWVGVAVATLWVVLLAGVDAVATSRQFREVSRLRLAARSNLRDKIDASKSTAAPPQDVNDECG